jgi:hypothetical protein
MGIREQTNEVSKKEEEESIEESLAKEIESLKDDKQRRKSELFVPFQTGVKGLVFIKINHQGVNPVEFIKSIFRDISSTQILKTRFVG